MDKYYDLYKSKIDYFVQNNKVMVFSKGYDPTCKYLKFLFSKKKFTDYKLVELDEMKGGEILDYALTKYCGKDTCPSVFIDGKYIGGHQETWLMAGNGKLYTLLNKIGLKNHLFP